MARKEFGVRGGVVYAGLPLLGVIAALAAGTAGAADRVCLLDDAKKVCLDLESIPGSAVQPSQDGGTPTYVEYTAKFQNMTSQSTRFISAQFSLQPAQAFLPARSHVPGNASCTFSGATASCLMDKLTPGLPLTIRLVTTAPAAEGTLTNTAVFGWEGRTSTAVDVLPVTQNAGKSFVPANTQVALVTSPENPNPANQATAENPLWAKLVLPALPFDYYASIEIVTDGPDFTSACVGGFFVAANEDGGPYVCRGTDDPRRWVRIGLSEGVVFPDTTPLQVTVISDTSIVPPLQLPPNPIAPTGVPPYAFFYRGPGNDDPFRAFADQCGTATFPCVSEVQQFTFEGGDWRAVLNATEFTSEDAGSLLPDLFGGIGPLGGVDPPVPNIFLL